MVRTTDGQPSPGSSEVQLRTSGAEGSLSPDLLDALNSDLYLLAQLARHPGICALAGLDVPAAETAAPEAAVERRRRSAELRHVVLMAYEYRCAFCGYDGALGGMPRRLGASPNRGESRQRRVLRTHWQALRHGTRAFLPHRMARPRASSRRRVGGRWRRVRYHHRRPRRC